MSSPASRLSQIASHLWNKPTPVSRNRAELSPTYFLPRAAAIEPDAEAIVHTTANGRILRRSYCEFADRARGVAYFVKKHGYKTVGILCPNTPAFLECIFGIAAGGALQVSANYRLKPEDIHYIFSHSGVDIIIVDREFAHLLEGYDPKVRIIVDEDTDATEGELSGEFDGVVWEGLEHDRKNGRKGWDGLEKETKDEESVFLLAYTSGTTARPKGVEFTHRGAYLAALGNVIESQLNNTDVLTSSRPRYLWTLPMFHAGGWTFPWAVTSVRGTHYCLRKVDDGHIWRLLREEGITHFNAAPTVNSLLCKSAEAERLPDPVRVTVAAAPPTPTLFEAMINLNLIPVHVYGMTETYGPITKGYFMDSWASLPSSELYQVMARQGHSFVTSKLLRVIKPNIDTIEDVMQNGKEIGEVVFTGNICSRGYFKDPEATDKLFHGGVLHSGDLAVWHPDGAIQILDRAKDIIISGGENISTVSLESMLAQHPNINEVAVVAVPDSHYGERPKAFITTSSKDLRADEVLAWAKKHPGISGFMAPREVEIVPELPKTATGKVRKNVLREWTRGHR